MQKYPLMTVKEAAEILRLEERSVRERLINGQLKGEKKTIGLREKWFVYKTAVDAALAKDQGHTLLEKDESQAEVQTAQSSSVAPVHTIDPQVETLTARVQELEALLRKNSVEESPSVTSTQPQSTDPKVEDDVVEAVISGEDSPVGEADLGSQPLNDTAASSKDTRSGTNVVADALWNNLICRFQEKLEEKDQLIGKMTSELEDKDRQLKLLPDLKKQAEQERLQAEDERKAAELKELEAEALRKQVAAMQAKQAEADLAIQKIEELEQYLTESRRAAEEEIERLKAEKEEEARALEAENERLKVKAEEAALSLEKLQLIERQMEVLKRPWWKKFFLPVPREDEG